MMLDVGLVYSLRAYLEIVTSMEQDSDLTKTNSILNCLKICEFLAQNGLDKALAESGILRFVEQIS